MAGYEPDCNDGEISLMPSTRDATPSIPADDEIIDEGFAHCLATPLLQVFSVCLSTVFYDRKRCEIHGSIQVFEGPDYHLCNLYDRSLEDPEILLESGALSLIGPHDSAIIPSIRTKLVIQLNDRFQGVNLVNKELKLDLSTQDSYDRLKQVLVEGDHGSVVVSYVVFRFAIYGHVHVRVVKNDNKDKTDKAADIYGSVVVRYDNCRMYCSGVEDDVKQLETRLFYHPSCRPLRVQAGTHIRMSRNVVAVPVYSTVAIQVNLSDLNGEIANDQLKFPVYLHCFSHAPLYFQTQYARVEVQIKWRNAYLDPNTMQVYHNQHLLAFLNPRSVPKKKPYFGTLKAEVFTVFVGGINEKVSAICGTILVDDCSLDEYSIFKRNEDSCELLRDESIACIEFNHRAIQNSVLYVVLNLTDPVGKREVSRGYACFHLGYAGRNMFERRVCMIVPGKDGYAAVHYEVFENAFEAFVDVKLFARNGDVDIPTSLYGTLLASYTSHTYSTSYEKTYYKSRLFDRPLDRVMETKTGSEFALLKSIVVVPVRSALIIEANLEAFGINNVVQFIDGKVQFKIDTRDTKSKTILGQEYGIEISIKFKP